MQTRLLIDSSVWIDYLTARDSWQTRFLSDAFSTHEICLCDFIITEVLQGIRDDKQFRATRDLLLSYALIPAHGTRIAVRAVENYRLLRKRGISLRTTIDCIIATAAIDAGVLLLANDRDYFPLVEHLGLNLVTA